MFGQQGGLHPADNGPIGLAAAKLAIQESFDQRLSPLHVVVADIELGQDAQRRRRIGVELHRLFIVRGRLFMVVQRIINIAQSEWGNRSG